MKQLDKLKNRVKIDKKMFIFLLIIMFVGIIAGSIFVSIINSSDKNLINEYLTNFLDSVQNKNIDYGFVFKSNIISALTTIAAIWLLGISVIGLPLIIVIFFSKSFILGFTIGSILKVYGFKGALFALVYTFPGQIISILMLLFISMYAISFCIKLIYVLFKKKTINFKIVMNKYLVVLLITITLTLLAVLYDTYLMPILVKNIISIIS